jgi:hypothetical protein
MEDISFLTAWSMLSVDTVMQDQQEWEESAIVEVDANV